MTDGAAGTGSSDAERRLLAAAEAAAHAPLVRDLQRASFVSAVSHEFRTPLTVISATIDMLADGMVEGEDARRLAGAAQRQVRRLERLVSGVLAAAGADEDQHEEVVTVDRLEPFVLDRLDVGHADRVVLDLDADEMVVSVPSRLGSALGMVVEQAVRQPGDDVVRVRVQRTEGGVAFTVNDEIDLAEGISPTSSADRGMAARLELDRGVVGTHLGLFTGEQIVRRLGGRLHVVRDGTRLAASLWLPQRRATDTPGRQRPRPRS